MTRIRLTTGDHAVEIDLDASATSEALVARLPLDVDVEDFHATEKIARLDARLPIDGAPDGHEPSSGELTYYAPWGNLALFYRDFGWAAGLVPLGRVVTGDPLASLDGPGRLELAD